MNYEIPPFSDAHLKKASINSPPQEHFVFDKHSSQT